MATPGTPQEGVVDMVGTRKDTGDMDTDRSGVLCDLHHRSHVQVCPVEEASRMGEVGIRVWH